MIPHHSLFNWIVYLIWVVGFGWTSYVIVWALIKAIRTRRAQIARMGERDGGTLLEASRAVRNEAIRLAVAGVFTLLGVWALISSDAPGGGSMRGRVTLVVFLLVGALVCSASWFDRADDATYLRQ